MARLASFVLNSQLQFQALGDALRSLGVSVAKTLSERTSHRDRTGIHGEISDPRVVKLVFEPRRLKIKIMPTIKITVTISANLITFITTKPYLPVAGS